MLQHKIEIDSEEKNSYEKCLIKRTEEKSIKHSLSVYENAAESHQRTI